MEYNRFDRFTSYDKDVRDAAEAGDASAQFCLARAIEAGMAGSEIKDTAKESAYWMEKAANQGHTEAQRCLAYRYERGEGVEQDKDKAFRLGEAAALGGNAMAMKDMCFWYSIGMGCAKNETKVVEWANKMAFDKTCSERAYGFKRLGLAYLDGKGGLPKDRNMALKCFEKSFSLEVDGSVANFIKAIHKTNENSNAVRHWEDRYAVNMTICATRGVEKEAVRVVKELVEGKLCNKSEKEAMYIISAVNRNNHRTNADALLLQGKLMEKGWTQGVKGIRKVSGLELKSCQFDAAMCYLDAAKLGNVEAQKAVAKCYREGIGVNRNTERAKLWEQAASGSGRPPTEAQLKEADKCEKGTIFRDKVDVVKKAKRLINKGKDLSL